MSKPWGQMPLPMRYNRLIVRAPHIALTPRHSGPRGGVCVTPAGAPVGFQTGTERVFTETLARFALILQPATTTAA